MAKNGAWSCSSNTANKLPLLHRRLELDKLLEELQWHVEQLEAIKEGFVECPEAPAAPASTPTVAISTRPTLHEHTSRPVHPVVILHIAVEHPSQRGDRLVYSDSLLNISRIRFWIS